MKTILSRNIANEELQVKNCKKKSFRHGLDRLKVSSRSLINERIYSLVIYISLISDLEMIPNRKIEKTIQNSRTLSKKKKLKFFKMET
jgi:hypothetical protein